MCNPRNDSDIDLYNPELYKVNQSNINCECDLNTLEKHGFTYIHDNINTVTDSVCNGIDVKYKKSDKYKRFEAKQKKINPNFTPFFHGSEHAVGLDLYAIDVEDLGDGRIKYDLGLAFELHKDFELEILPRSSIHKTGLMLSNSKAVGDPDFRGYYSLVFYNVIKELPNYKIGDRIGQMIIRSFYRAILEEKEELNETKRGNGGYGSTGK